MTSFTILLLFPLIPPDQLSLHFLHLLSSHLAVLFTLIPLLPRLQMLHRRFLAERHPYFTASGTLAPLCLMPVCLRCLPLPLCSPFRLTFPSFQRYYSGLIWLREFLLFLVFFSFLKKRCNPNLITHFYFHDTLSVLLLLFFLHLFEEN